jgi:hypothetical protein
LSLGFKGLFESNIEVENENNNDRRIKSQEEICKKEDKEKPGTLEDVKYKLGKEYENELREKKGTNVRQE